MSGMTQPPEVADNTAQSRFELRIGDALAELIYRRRADRLVLVHTEVPAELGGRGIGGQLVQAALATAAAEDLTVVPLCPFARSWLERHPDAAAGIRLDWDSR
jgi:predicted GNAT family acetyltransferase